MIITTKLLLVVMTGCMSVPAYAAACGTPSSTWIVVSRVPDHTREHPVNVLAIEARGGLHWNGSDVTERQVRQYLKLITQMRHGNITVLKPHTGAPYAIVAKMRETVDEVLGCGRSSCVEIITDTGAADNQVQAARPG